MITYELARRLKELGFPQGSNCICSHNISPSDGFHIIKGLPLTLEGICLDDSAYLPTLSELIESCGGKFGALARYNISDTEELIGWKARGRSGDLEETLEVCEKGMVTTYSTPEEAVSMFWLELNKK